MNSKGLKERLTYYKKIYRVYLRFLIFLKPYWRAGVIAGVLMLLTALLQLPTPLLTRYLIDEIVPAKDLARLNLFSVLLITLVMVLNFLSYFEQKVLIIYRNRVQSDIRQRLFSKLFCLRYDFFEKEKIGYWHSRIDNDVSRLQQLFLETFLDIGMNLLTFVVGAGLLLYLNFRLALISFLLLPAFIITFHVFSRRMNEYSLKNQEAWARQRGDSVEYLKQNLLVRTFGKVERCLQLFKKSLAAAIDSSQRMELYGAISSIVIGLVAAIIPLFILWYGVRQIILGQFSLGGFIAFNSCIGYLYNPVRRLVNLNIDIHSAVAAAERVFKIIDYEEENFLFGKEELERFEELAFKEVSFSYENGERGIEQISFELKKNESMVIVGETGSGKSTILKLILGLYRLNSGEIVINGRSITDYSLPGLRKRIGYVEQEAELFSGSVLENITFFEEDYDRDFLNQIISVCELREVISRFPQGLETNILESGEGISGGERQRIALARALYRQPQLLLLDEASSALDVETERKIFENLLGLSWKPALIVVTHRLQLVDYFQKLMRLEQKRAGLQEKR